MIKINKKKLRYGSGAAAVTVLVLCAAVLINVIAAALVGRFDWMFVELFRDPVYAISDDCREYLEEYVIPKLGDDGRIRVVFCNDREAIEADTSQAYVHDSFYEIKDMFPEHIAIEYINIWENPSEAKALGVTAQSDVVCVWGDRAEAMNLEDFYVFSAADQTSPVAYNGEKIIASCMMRVTQEETPMCYFTANHGESFKDYEFMRLIVESGYSFSYLDLVNEEIPEDCELLVTFDPKQDLLATNDISEREKLDEYMAQGGKYMVFLSADTFASGGRDSLEGFLADWGVKLEHAKGADGTEECHLIKDGAHSLTVDGYTVLARRAQSGHGADMLPANGRDNVLGNTGRISVSSGFASDGKGNYTNGKREMSPLLVSYPDAEAWAGGRAVERADDDGFILMSMSREAMADGESAYLIACASTEFAGESAMQSSVLGNSQTVAEILRGTGKDNIPTSLVFKSFSGTKIESLPVARANAITVVLAAIPALTAIGVGTAVLLRRKNR